jgi:hypothetical protein
VLLFYFVLQAKLLGQMLYYVLTTGSGQQTLGEEYCDVTQVFIIVLKILIYSFITCIVYASL